MANSSNIVKTIQLTQDKVAFVDDEDFESLNVFKWYAHKYKHTYYAQRAIRVGDRQRIIKMHRVILDLQNKYPWVDHEDGNGLNNQRCNLRVATYLQNQMNKRKKANCSSIFKGVSWHLRTGKYQTRIAAGELINNGNHKTISLGYFDDEIEAAYAYDAAARKYFGEFAKLNFPVDNPGGF
jgi:hypothetical protein